MVQGRENGYNISCIELVDRSLFIQNLLLERGLNAMRVVMTMTICIGIY